MRADRARVRRLLLRGVHDGARGVGGLASGRGDAEPAAALAGRRGRRGDLRRVTRDAGALLRVLGEARHERRGRASAFVRVRALRAEGGAAGAADGAPPSRVHRRRAPGVQRLVRGDGGRIRDAVGRGGNGRLPVPARGLAAADGLAGEGCRVAAARPGWARVFDRAALRVDRGALDAGCECLPADPLLEPAVDLHRVLRVARGGIAARSRGRAHSVAGAGGGSRVRGLARRHSRPDQCGLQAGLLGARGRVPERRGLRGRDRGAAPGGRDGLPVAVSPVSRDAGHGAHGGLRPHARLSPL